MSPRMSPRAIRQKSIIREILQLPSSAGADARGLPSFLRFGLRGLLLLWPRAACRRDDTVHPQVLDHLTVVILRMEGADNGDCETR